jgi:hypothetical protein
MRRICLLALFVVAVGLTGSAVLCSPNGVPLWSPLDDPDGYRGGIVCYEDGLKLCPLAPDPLATCFEDCDAQNKCAGQDAWDRVRLTYDKVKEVEPPAGQETYDTNEDVVCWEKMDCPVGEDCDPLGKLWFCPEETVTLEWNRHTPTTPTGASCASS